MAVSKKVVKKASNRSEPPKPKDLPSIKGKSPRPNASRVNPKAPSTADVDRILKKAARDWAPMRPAPRGGSGAPRSSGGNMGGRGNIGGGLRRGSK